MLLCGLLERRNQNTEEPDQKNLCRAQAFFISSTACPLLATLLVTGILGFLEASGGLCFLEGPMLPKGPALVFVPKVAGSLPVCALSNPSPKSSLLLDLRGSASEARRPERGSGEKVTLSFFSPSKPEGLGTWQHVQEGLVILLTEGCLQDSLNSFSFCSGPR